MSEHVEGGSKGVHPPSFGYQVYIEEILSCSSSLIYSNQYMTPQITCQPRNHTVSHCNPPPYLSLDESFSFTLGAIETILPHRPDLRISAPTIPKTREATISPF